MFLTARDSFFTIALAFLNEECTVRGPCRPRSQVEEWIAMLPQHKSKFESSVIDGIVTPHAVDEVVKSVDTIMHTASLFHFNMTVRFLLSFCMTKPLFLPFCVATELVASLTCAPSSRTTRRFFFSPPAQGPETSSKPSNSSRRSSVSFSPPPPP